MLHHLQRLQLPMIVLQWLFQPSEPLKWADDCAHLLYISANYCEQEMCQMAIHPAGAAAKNTQQSTRNGDE
jgi:hypothetical protein